jgi:membrane-associated phospholipid phosphatase
MSKLSCTKSRAPGYGAAIALSLCGALACGDPTSAPVVSTPAMRAPPALASLSGATKFWDAGASIGWNRVARDYVSALAVKPNQQATLRAFTYLSLAQYDAVLAAEDARERGSRPSPQAAVASASAVVLSYVFPAGATGFESAVRAQAAAPRWPGEANEDFAAGERVGRAIGAAVVTSAMADRFDAVWTGSVPVGPGLWTGTAPLLPLLGRMRTFFMTSGSQFRPPPPPAFGSPEFTAALAEVRLISDTRTPQQLAIAQYWAATTGSLAAGFWNEQASDLILRYRLDERRAAHTLALSNMAAMDANIACHDAKYTYWLLRPWQADPAITTPIGRPNHPSYPSNHACVSGTMAYTLGATFPEERDRLAAMADEAGESRLYAGIHYEFDKDAGLLIARRVSDLALSLDVHGREPFAVP